MIDVFLVSMIYWVALLVLFLWLYRRIVHLTVRLSRLEKGELSEEGSRRA
jgi:hypothetical protein